MINHDIKDLRRSRLSTKLQNTYDSSCSGHEQQKKKLKSPKLNTNTSIEINDSSSIFVVGFISR